MLPAGRVVTTPSGFPRSPDAVRRMLAFPGSTHRRADGRRVRVITLVVVLVLLAWIATLYATIGARIKDSLAFRPWEWFSRSPGGKGGKKGGGADKGAGVRKASVSADAGGATGRNATAEPGSQCARGGGDEGDEGAWKRRHFAPHAAWPPESTVQCSMWGTWTEACHYENVCFDAHERQLLFWKDPDSPGTGIGPEGAQDWAAGEGTFADAAANPGVYDAANDRDPTYSIPAFSPRRVHISHNDLLTGQVLPLVPFPRYSRTRPKLFPFNSNMKGRFMSRPEAVFHWKRTAAEWARDRGASVGVPAEEELPLWRGDDDHDHVPDADASSPPVIPLSDAAAQRVIFGAPLPGASTAVPGEPPLPKGHKPAKRQAPSAAGLAPFLGEDVTAPVDDTALVLSNKVQLQNIWYYSSRLTPWFEARRLNASGMLPFLLPQPAVIHLHTTANLVGADWHRSFAALALGFPKAVLFPELYGGDGGGGTAELAPAAAPAAAAAPPAVRGRKAPPTRTSSRTPKPVPTVVTHPNGVRFWNGHRVPKLLYRAPIPGKLGSSVIDEATGERVRGGGGGGAGGGAAGGLPPRTGGAGGGVVAPLPPSGGADDAGGGGGGVGAVDEDAAPALSGPDVASAVDISGPDVASAVDADGDPETPWSAGGEPLPGEPQQPTGAAPWELAGGDAAGAGVVGGLPGAATDATADTAAAAGGGDGASDNGEPPVALGAALGRRLLEGTTGDGEEAAGQVADADLDPEGAAEEAATMALAGEFLVSEDEEDVAAEEAAVAAAAAAAAAARAGTGGRVSSRGAAKAAAPGAARGLAAAAPGGAPAPPPAAAAFPVNMHAPESRTRCYRKLTLTGASGFVFGDTHSAAEFRHAALLSVGRGTQPKFLGPGVGKFYAPHLPPRKGA
jgi:hypothetical protein